MVAVLADKHHYYLAVKNSNSVLVKGFLTAINNYVIEYSMLSTISSHSS